MSDVWVSAAGGGAAVLAGHCGQSQNPVQQAAPLNLLSDEPHYAKAHLCANLLQEAAKLYQRATAADPNNERTWLQLGLLERRRGQSAAARECFRRGTQAAPHNPYMYQAGTAPCVWATGSGSA